MLWYCNNSSSFSFYHISKPNKSYHNFYITDNYHYFSLEFWLLHNVQNVRNIIQNNGSISIFQFRTIKNVNAILINNLTEHWRSIKQTKQIKNPFRIKVPLFFRYLKSLASVFYYQFTKQFLTLILTFKIFISFMHNCYILHVRLKYIDHLHLIKFH